MCPCTSVHATDVFGSGGLGDFELLEAMLVSSWIILGGEGAEELCGGSVEAPADVFGDMVYALVLATSGGGDRVEDRNEACYS